MSNLQQDPPAELPTDAAREAAEPSLSEARRSISHVISNLPVGKRFQDEIDMLTEAQIAMVLSERSTAVLRREVEGLKAELFRVHAQRVSAITALAEATKRVRGQRDAARAELERVKQALGIADRAMTHAGDDLAQLRADLAAAREERDEARHILGLARMDNETLIAIRERLIAENNTLTARAVEAERERDEMHGHLGEMLDEIRTTERGHWPHHLFCVECGCNVSKVEPHDPACKIGLAIAAWDVIDAARVAGLPGDGEGN